MNSLTATDFSQASYGTASTGAAGGPRLVTSPGDIGADRLYIDIERHVARKLVLKCEGLNAAGSVKIKSARAMLRAAKQAGILAHHGRFVESSSGSLGVALAMLAADEGLAFTCVTDSRCNPSALQLMRAYGAEVVVITEPHPVHGLLGARLRYIESLVSKDAGVIWLNQYENHDNWRAHYETTGPEIAQDFPAVDFVFIGAGTTGTLTGTARYLRDINHPATIVAVDTCGSVTFGQPTATRHIPGLGTGKRPPITDDSVIHELLMVPETAAIRTCRDFASRGLLLGGSTGSVLAAALHRLKDESSGMTSLVISPDFGERYLDTVYDDVWVKDRFDLDSDAITPVRVELGRQK